MSTSNFVRVLFLSLGLVYGLTTATTAGVTNNNLALPRIPVKNPSNSTTTFHTDINTLSVNLHRALQQEELRRQHLAQTMSTRWYRNNLASAMIPQATPNVAPSANDKANGTDNGNTTQDPKRTNDTSFQWKAALSQAMTFLWIEHAFRFATEPGTRAEMRGPFFKDWWTSVQRTRGWRDGDPFIVNYIGHPMQGSVTNYIYIHNDPKSVKLEAGFNKAYFKSRLKAMLFSTVYSTQFELGPIGEAALGNVGRVPSKTSRHPSAFVDLVITPTLGTVWMMGEDTLDRLVVKRMENHVTNRWVRLLVRGFLSPSHSFANALRGKYPWHRDGRRL